MVIFEVKLRELFCLVMRQNDVNMNNMNNMGVLGLCFVEGPKWDFKARHEATLRKMLRWLEDKLGQSYTNQDYEDRSK